MWTPATRRQHNRDHLRYGSDLSDAEWENIAPFMPPPAKTGRPRRWTMREIMNAIFYVLRAGCAWRLLPKSRSKKLRFRNNELAWSSDGA